ncbi:MAG: PQQ-binding-like beta-propeller repeat protein [Cytophagales bacterium]|nr:PQQ-binding-like beta-propeller repeat protein [Cytophagales bacterium]
MKLLAAILIQVTALLNPCPGNSQTSYVWGSLTAADVHDPACRQEDSASTMQTPVIDEGIVYATGSDSTFYALDLQSGNVKWYFKAGHALRSTLTHGIKLYINDNRGNFYAVNKKTGKVLWTFVADRERECDFSDYPISPLLHNNILYFGTPNGDLFAINTDTGDKLWSYETGELVHSRPSVKNNKVLFGSASGNLYALDIELGELLWAFRAVGKTYLPPGEAQTSQAMNK